jgi:methionine-gamma-lyase
MSLHDKMRLATRIIHFGSHPDPHTGSLNVPIYQTSTFVFKSAEEGGRRFSGQEKGYIYTRLGNPNHVVIEEKLAMMEGAEAAVCASSGMGAIAAAFWTLLGQGTHVVADKTLYGCTYSLLKHCMHRYGVETTFVDCSDLKAVEAAFRPNTKLLYFESPANPTLAVYDIEALAAIGHRHKVMVGVDNTFCTPYLQRPLEFGVDFVIHSATKFLNGHGDVIAGFVAGTKAFIDQVRAEGIKDMTGSTLGPFEAFLIMRGIKTLPLRMDRHCANAQVVAEHLAGHPMVESIAYPGLPGFPARDLVKKQMLLPGSLITFNVKGGFEAAKAVANAVEMCALAVSLGDVETLIQHPASMTHCSYKPDELAEAGIGLAMLRVSVGLEDPADVIADLDQALAKA